MPETGVIELIRDSLNRIEDKLDEHLVGVCSTQKELSEHKKNHKWIIVTTIMSVGLIITIYELLAR